MKRIGTIKATRQSGPDSGAGKPGESAIDLMPGNLLWLTKKPEMLIIQIDEAGAREPLTLLQASVFANAVLTNDSILQTECAKGDH